MHGDVCKALNFGPMYTSGFFSLEGLSIIKTRPTNKQRRLKLYNVQNWWRVDSVHFWHRIHPKKPWIWQEMVQFMRSKVRSFYGTLMKRTWTFAASYLELSRLEQSCFVQFWSQSKQSQSQLDCCSFTSVICGGVWHRTSVDFFLNRRSNSNRKISHNGRKSCWNYLSSDGKMVVSMARSWLSHCSIKYLRVFFEVNSWPMPLLWGDTAWLPGHFHDWRWYYPSLLKANRGLLL
jgi:hypothetical protein